MSIKSIRRKKEPKYTTTLSGITQQEADEMKASGTVFFHDDHFVVEQKKATKWILNRIRI